MVGIQGLAEVFQRLGLAALIPADDVIKRTVGDLQVVAPGILDLYGHLLTKLLGQQTGKLHIVGPILFYGGQFLPVIGEAVAVVVVVGVEFVLVRVCVPVLAVAFARVLEPVLLFVEPDAINISSCSGIHHNSITFLRFFVSILFVICYHFMQFTKCLLNTSNFVYQTFFYRFFSY